MRKKNGTCKILLEKDILNHSSKKIEQLKEVRKKQSSRLLIWPKKKTNAQLQKQTQRGPDHTSQKQQKQMKKNVRVLEQYPDIWTIFCRNKGLLEELWKLVEGLVTNNSETSQRDKQPNEQY